MRERLRTGSDGTSEPGRTGQDRAKPGKTGLAAGSMVFSYELPVQILRVFRPELALLSGENAIRVHKKVPIRVRHLASEIDGF